MAKCVKCGKPNAEYFTSEGKSICEKCSGSGFTCPECGRIFEDELADAGDGFCSACTGK